MPIVALTALNNFMKNYPSGEIVPQQYEDVSLYSLLRGSIDQSSFVGSNIEILIQTVKGYTGKPHYENADMPVGKSPAFAKMLIPLREVIVIAGITKQARDRATGGNSSWGRILDRVISDLMDDFNWLMEITALSSGQGVLGEVAAAGAPSNDGTHTTVSLDNDYTTLGVENSQLCKVGMGIEVVASGMGSLRAVVGGEITAVTFGDRNNGAPVSGSIVFTDTALHSVADGDLICLKGSFDSGLLAHTTGFGPLPMGLTGLIHEAASRVTLATALTNYADLARGSYPTLRAKVYQATDFDSGGADGTPSDWGISTITDAIEQVSTSTGGKTDVLFMSQKLARALDRKNRSESSMSVVVPSTGGMTQLVVGSKYSRQFECADGRLIPIEVSHTIPANVLYGLCRQDLSWYPFGSYDYLRLSGDVWDKSYADRKTNFEAPYGGYHQVAGSRLDRQFCIQDMRTDV